MRLAACLRESQQGLGAVPPRVGFRRERRLEVDTIVLAEVDEHVDIQATEDVAVDLVSEFGGETQKPRLALISSGSGRCMSVSCGRGSGVAIAYIAAFLSFAVASIDSLLGMVAAAFDKVWKWR